MLNIRSRVGATNGSVLVLVTCTQVLAPTEGPAWVQGYICHVHVVSTGMPHYQICCSRTIDFGEAHRLDGPDLDSCSSAA